MTDLYMAALDVQRLCEQQGWIDVDGILARQKNRLNLELVRDELKPLADLKEDPQITRRLEEKIARHSQPFTRIAPRKQRQDPT
jgi:hypothetical protein